jgi:endoglucanase
MLFGISSGNHRRMFVRVLLIACLLASSSAAFAQLPSPTYGWNIGNTMEPPGGAGTWGGAPSQALINSVAASGFNVVRIPCAWDSHADKHTHLIDPVYMSQVKQVVDWCYAKRLYVIVNDHWDDGWLEKNIKDTVDPAINTKMQSYWTQIADAFKGYNSHLLFAAANEPNVKTAAQMATLLAYYQTFVDAVRDTGGNNRSRWLVLQGANADFDNTCSLMNTLPNDPTPRRLMIEVHYYGPYQFALMSSDATWGKMFYFWGKGYHSSTDTSRNSTWGEEDYVDTEFQKIYTKFVSKGIPVMLGEFRAAPRSNLTSSEAALNYASTTYWDKYILDTAQKHGMYPVVWDTPGSLFDWNTGAIKDQRTITALTGGAAIPPPAP